MVCILLAFYLPVEWLAGPGKWLERQPALGLATTIWGFSRPWTCPRESAVAMPPVD